jgi:hypothetical protein
MDKLNALKKWAAAEAKGARKVADAAYAAYRARVAERDAANDAAEDAREAAMEATIVARDAEATEAAKVAAAKGRTWATAREADEADA